MRNWRFVNNKDAAYLLVAPLLVWHDFVDDSGVIRANGRPYRMAVARGTKARIDGA